MLRKWAYAWSGLCSTYLTAGVIALVLALAPRTASADENGVSFWLPGIYGSLAAAPLQPGFSFTTFYYHTSVEASGQTARAREISIGQIPATLTANVSANLNADLDVQFVLPSYTFATPVLGGQATRASRCLWSQQYLAGCDPQCLTARRAVCAYRFSVFQHRLYGEWV
jgi:hypothetical protein